MIWIKLRLGYFEEIESFENEKSNVFYVSDGICGTYTFKYEDKNKTSFLTDDINFIHPDIISEKLADSIKNFY